MGLDQNLYRKHYVQNWDFKPVKWDITIKYDDAVVPQSQINLDKLTYILEEVAYWRKANHIHRWFVQNVQDGNDDCRDYYLGEDQLRILLSQIEAVLADHSRAAELLPTQEGFFFGGVDYDEYYFSELERTRDILNNLVDHEDESPGFSGYIYSSSW